MEKYEPLGVVGEGSYGVVLKCRHRESGRSVAIKKFIDSEDDQNVRKIALREIRVLRKLRHENLVNLLEVFRRRKHLYLVFEFIDHTLLDELEGKTKGLDGEICRKYVYQILRGLGFCHDNNIIHRDVKPENVLVSKNGIVKLCDFGFARHLCGPGEQYTDYVATRWYRAPELLVGDVAYGKEVDIWAVGCLFSEMLSGEPLFPGDSDIDQLFLIAQCLGRLARRHLSIMSRNSAFRGFQFPVPKSRHGSTASNDSNSQQGHPKLAKLDSSGSTSTPSHRFNKQNQKPPDLSIFSSLFPSWEEEAVHFLTLCLDPEPSGRPGCNALLRLPYFTNDNFPSRFINELNQKLQLEGRQPIIPMRKKRSVLGTLQQHGAKVGSYLKKNPLYQARTNLNLAAAEENTNSNNSNTNAHTTKYSEVFSTSTILKHPPLVRDQTFLVDPRTGGGTTKFMQQMKKQQHPGGESQDTKIPSLLNRKYSDDSLLKYANSTLFNNGSSNSSTIQNVNQNGGSKSTPNIAATTSTLSGSLSEESNRNTPTLVTPQKRYSMQLQGQNQPQNQNQPRKFSYSFPPPQDKEKENNNKEQEEPIQKHFQPLPVTTLTFSLGQGGYSSLSKSPNLLNVTSYGTQLQVKSPSKMLNGNITSNSSYFPHTHFSTIQQQHTSTIGTNTNGRFPVSFYQGNVNVNINPKSLPVSVFGSSMVLKNPLVDTESFLPRMNVVGRNSGKDHQGKDDESSIPGFSKHSGGSLPRRRDSFSKWEPHQKLTTTTTSTVGNLKGVIINKNNAETTNPRHFSTNYGTQ